MAKSFKKPSCHTRTNDVVFATDRVHDFSSPTSRETTPDCIIFCNIDGIITGHTFFHTSFLKGRIVGYSFDSAFRLRYDYPGISSARYFAISGILQGHIVHSIPVLDERKYGDSMNLILTAFPQYLNERITGCVIMLTDVTSQKRSELRMEQHVRDIAFLSQTAMHLVENISNEDLYTYLAKQIRSILGDAITFTSAYDPKSKRLTVRSAQMNLSDIDGVTKLLRTRIQGLSIPFDNSFPMGLHNIGLYKFSGGLHDLTMKHFSKSVCHRIEQFLKIRAIYVMPISIGDKFLGALVIFTRAPASLKNIHLIEALTNQVTMALKRQTTEILLREERDKLQKYFDVSGTIILVIDRDQNISLINKRGCEILGYRDHEIIGKNWFRNFVPLRLRIRTLSYWRSILRNPPERIMSFENPILTKNGDERIISWKNTVFKDEMGALYATLSSGEDITEIRKAEEILKRDTLSFNAMVKDKTAEILAAQQELDQMKRLSDIGTLSATMAHELRNPLGVIQLASHNIKKKPHDPSIDKHLHSIDNKVVESNRIINNILSFAKFKMPSYEQVPLRSLIEDSIVALLRRLETHPVMFSRNYSISNKDYVDADPVQLRELMDNVLNNAYESLFSKNGTIDLSASYDGGSSYTIKVKDNGIGISSSDLPRVYEPFFTRKSRGTGLGLTVCSRIVKLHNGTIDIESAPGKGTCVTVTLPLKRPGH